ncbi:uncharacterized protein LOC144293967 isoform X4 [Canis aureus]
MVPDSFPKLLSGFSLSTIFLSKQVLEQQTVTWYFGICQGLARHDSGRNQASLPSAACICCLCISCILPEQKKRLASIDSSFTSFGAEMSKIKC